MNREQKRAFVKKAKKRGVKESEAKAYAEIISGGSGDNTPSQEILDGEKVTINTEAVRARKNYEQMNPKYKEFVESSNGREFTARVKHGNMIELVEEDKWLFWSGDLIKVSEQNNSERVSKEG